MLTILINGLSKCQKVELSSNTKLKFDISASSFLVLCSLFFILIVPDTVEDPQEEDVDVAGNEEDDNCDTSDLMRDIGTHSIT